MPKLLNGILAGALAGAAGATALNTVSYGSQAAQAQPASSTPGQTVTALADTAGVDIPGKPDEKENRVEALGPLAGIGVGVGVGAIAGLLRSLKATPPFAVSAIAIGLGAMALSDSVMTALKITDPRSWTLSSVAQDAIPHLVYGVTTTAALHLMLDPATTDVGR